MRRIIRKTHHRKYTHVINRNTLKSSQAIRKNVTEHQTLEIPICMLHGDNRKGEFPSDIKATVEHGENLQALVVALNTVGAVSIKRTHEILSGVFDIPISTGTISNMVKRCADKLTDTVGKIKVKTKVFGCFRSEDGAREYLKIMSYIGTAHKQGYNAYEAIKNAISGHSDFIFE